MTFDIQILFWNLCISSCFILGMISTVIAFKTQSRVYVYYALYLLVLILYLTLKMSLLTDFFDSFNINLRRSLNWYIQIVYHLLYSRFGLEFLSVKKYSERLYRNSNRVLVFWWGLSTVTAWVDFGGFDSMYILNYFAYIHLPFILSFAGYIIYRSYKSNSSIVAFFSIGLIVYLLFSISAFVFTISLTQEDFDNANFPLGLTPITYFYIGVMLETFIISYGIAYQTELIFNKNKAYQKQLIESERRLNSHLGNIIEKQEKENEILLQKNLTERLRRKQASLENEIAQLKIVALKNQMNSHFIFNILNSIKACVIQESQKKAIVFINKFAKFIRKTLEYSDQEESSLEEELEFSELYVTLENMRFEHEIDYFLLVDKDIYPRKVSVPSMILQPFVENAIWHGLSQKEGDKKLWIVVSREQNGLQVSVKDNGIGRKKSHTRISDFSSKQSMGLNIANEKINHFNKKHKTSLHFEIVDLPQGVASVLTIPQEIEKAS